MTLLEKEWFIEAPWGRMCIVAWGDCCDPPVLLCHGVNDSATSFRPLIKLLPKRFYYIGMNLPGCDKSDPLPGGLLYSVYDLVYAIQVVVKHFRWDQFVYLGHSLGSSLGKFYNLSYPGKMSKIIDLDPISLGVYVPPEKLPEWYDRYFTKFFSNYNDFTSESEEKSKYTRDEAVAKLMKIRHINREVAEELVTRNTKTVENKLLRFTFDERIRHVVAPPYTLDYIKQLLASIKTPTLLFMSDQSKYVNNFDKYLLEIKSDTFKVIKVIGRHDVHVSNPDRIASFASQFLLYGLNGVDSRAKL